jgi:multisubunit Na+/H+ antiporter MnhB subunit
MEYKNKVSGIVAIAVALAMCLCVVALATGPASATATAGSIAIDGIDANGVVEAKAFDVTISATGTDINQTVLEGKVAGGTYVVLETWDFTGTNTSIEEVYAAEFDGQTDYVFKLCILDGSTWNNNTLAEVQVKPYYLPMMNDDASALNLIAFVVCIGGVMCVIWYILMRNDKTNKGERREIAKDFAIASGIAFIAITAVFVYLGGYTDNILAWFGMVIAQVL